MKYLNIFETEAAYTSAQSNLELPNTSLIQETNRSAYKLSDNVLPEFDPRYLYSDLTASTDLVANKTVIGIEVIPESAFKNISGFEGARFMSVKNMSRSNPELGSVEEGNSSSNSAAIIPWGKTNDTVSTITSYTNLPKALYRDDSEITDENPWGITDQLSQNDRGSCIISDTCRSLCQCGGNFDLNVKYPFREEYYLPSYIQNYTEVNLESIIDYVMDENGTVSPNYRQSETCTFDIDGKGNTAKLIERIAVSGWESGDLNTNVSGAINHPAAAACYRFTAGVPSLVHQWYLPAMGELGFLWANIGKINRKLAKLPTSVGIPVGLFWSDYGGTADFLGGWLWSSSQDDAYYAWGLDSGGGGLDSNLKGYAGEGGRVRAFLQL